MKSFQLDWRANLVFALALLLSVGLAFQYYSKETKDSQRQARLRFERASKTRHARLLLRMENRKQLLDALSSLFTASGSVEKSEFHDFGAKLVGERLRAVCWNSSDGQQSFSVSGDPPPKQDLCKMFDLTEPSRAFGEDPHVILSNYAPSRNGQQRGFASVIFAVRDISLGDREPNLDEFITIVDRSQNVVQTFELGQEGSKKVENKDSTTANNALFFEVESFGSFGFVYRTEFRGLESSPVPRAFFFALLALGFVAATFMRSQLVTRRRITREVIRRTEELSQFAYRTSHDLRAPLVTISGLCRAAQEDLDDGDYAEVASNLERINKHSSRLNELVGDILDLTKADVADEEASEVDFEQLCKEVTEQIDLTFPEHGVLLNYEIECPPVRIPRGRALQILSNLISNGVKYADREKVEPFVKTHLSYQSGTLRLVVSDNGLGIPPDRLATVFDMFERFHPGAGQTGSGLGMSIVKRHVNRLSGSISIDSDETGTSVKISLPVRRKTHAS